MPLYPGVPPWADYAELGAGPGRDAARDRLMGFYEPLVKSVAARVGRRLPPSVELEDLIQAGRVGLWQAIERFDLGRGGSFEGFAYPHVRGAMIDFVRSEDVLPKRMRTRETARAIARSRFFAQHGRAPDAEEMADALRFPAGSEQWPAAETTAFSQIGPHGSDRWASETSQLADERQADVPTLAHRAELRQLMLTGFTAEERRVLELHHQEGLNFVEIGRLMGRSKSWVQKTHARLLLILRLRLGPIQDQIDASDE